MNVKEHLSFSIYSTTLLIAGTVTIKHLNIDYEQMTKFIFGVGVGALLPDMDHKNSISGHVLPFHLLHKLFPKSKIFRHGGITHTFIVNLWIFIAGYLLNNWLSWFLYGIAFGYFTHLYLDDITGNKLPIKWWPIEIKKQNKKWRKK